MRWRFLPSKEVTLPPILAVLPYIRSHYGRACRGDRGLAHAEPAAQITTTLPSGLVHRGNHAHISSNRGSDRIRSRSPSVLDIVRYSPPIPFLFDRDRIKARNAFVVSPAKL